ncbi:MAG TPA: polysaccharide biosynthesis/export family protein [Acidobacteriaceae bacterium]
MRLSYRFTAPVLLACGLICGAAWGQESLLIGPGDLLHVQVQDTPELDQHPRVTDAGEIPLSGIGTLAIGGLTPAAAAARIHDYLISTHYMNHPAVTVTVDQYATQTISVLGQVKLPGVFPITAPRSVLDAIALGGGLADNADRHVTIQRRDRSIQPITYDLSNDATVAMKTQVLVYPGDIVLVPHATVAYVLGDVTRPGGILMQNNHSQLTALQAVTLAGGTLSSAVPAHARLIRKTPAGGYQEIAMNFSRIQKGKDPDVLLQQDDVIYIPFSYLRNIAATSSGIVASSAQATIYAIP